MNVNDVVIYTEHGKDHVATVLEIRYLENHLGKSGEPLLHLGFFAPVLRPGANGVPTRVSIAGTHQQYDLAQFRLDVAHQSHEFDPALKAPTYPGGRWKEATVVVNPEIFDDLDEQEVPKPEETGATDSGIPASSPNTNVIVTEPAGETHKDDSIGDGAEDETHEGDAATEGTIH